VRKIKILDETGAIWCTNVRERWFPNGLFYYVDKYYSTDKIRIGYKTYIKTIIK
jgi:hypothetical protein